MATQPLRRHATRALAATACVLCAVAAQAAAWTTGPALPAGGEPFVVQITLCPASAQLVKVDAEMPDHRHGMNYQPSLIALGDGRWRVEGMVWHMAGRWLLKVDARLDGNPHRLTQSVVLK